MGSGTTTIRASIVNVLQSHRSCAACVARDCAPAPSVAPPALRRTRTERVYLLGRFRLLRDATEPALKQHHHSNSELPRAPDRLAGPTRPIDAGAGVLDLHMGSAANHAAPNLRAWNESSFVEWGSEHTRKDSNALPDKVLVSWRNLWRMPVRGEVWLSQALRGKQVKEFSPTLPIDSAIWWGIEELAALEKSGIWLEFSLAS